MGFIEDLFSSIFDALGSLWEELKSVFAVILLVAAIVFFPPLGIAGWIGLSLSTTALWALFAASVVAAFLIDPEAAAEIVDDIGTAIGDATESFASVAGTVATSFLSSPLGLAMLGLGAYFIFGRRSNQ